ncbi:MAG: amidohydrolase family protein [Microbacterium sp.]|uniref:amidohydrolase family protein n=1 Tax=Microbacterium sp. TaxID=51671 RepID=UPI0039E37125
MLVDHQTHWHPLSYLERMNARPGFPAADIGAESVGLTLAGGQRWTLPRALFDIEYSMSSMDRHGIDAMVSSPIYFAAFHGLSEAEAEDAASFVNSETARMQADSSGRLVGLAVAPMQYPAVADRVVRRAADLGLRGVCVLSNYDGETPTAGRHLPVYRAMDETGQVCVLHPAMRARSYEADAGIVVERGLDWMHDTAHAALSMVASGILDECQNLSVLHPHAGGVLPYVWGRAADISGRDLRSYLRTRFYVDTAVNTPGALDFAIQLYGADRVVFATDDPFVPRDRSIPFQRGELGDRVEGVSGNQIAQLMGS